jgi:hypothetical protein
MTPIGEVMSNIRIAWAGLEKQTMSERTPAGMERAREEGSRSAGPASRVRRRGYRGSNDQLRRGRIPQGGHRPSLRRCDDLAVASPPSPLWRNRPFSVFWVAQTISHAGSHVSELAIPLTAALTLGASAAEMGLLGAAELLPPLVLGLLAGMIVG